MDGARYVGSWLNNLKHGRVGSVVLALSMLTSLFQGKYIHADGEVFDGTFVDDKPIGVDGPITPRQSGHHQNVLLSSESVSIHLHLAIVSDIF